MLVPTCQAKGCDAEATEAIPSRHAHPGAAWQLCRAHFCAVEGRDPWHVLQKGWTLQKLRFRCRNCDYAVGHNALDDLERCPICSTTTPE